MKAILKKALVTFAGLIAILIILEFALRILGAFSQSGEPADYSDFDPGKSAYTILCMGDSHTQGYLMDKNRNYPAQLEQILNEESDKTFRVINVGTLAQNTAQLLSVLEEQIDRYRPDLILLMTGGANHWNYYGYHDSGEDFLYNFRVYKLIKLLIKGAKDKAHIYNYAGREKEHFKNKIEHYKNLITQDPDETRNYFYVGFYNYKLQKFREAIKWFKKGIRVNPHFGNNYIMTNISYAFLADKDAATKWLEEEMKLNPDNPLPYDLMSSNLQDGPDLSAAVRYAAMARARDNSGFSVFLEQIEGIQLNELEKRAADADENYRKMLESTIRFRPDFYEYGGGKEGEKKIIDKNMDLVIEWVKDDLSRIVEISQLKKTKLFLLTYALKPEKSSWTITSQFVNYAIEDVADQYAVPLVENERIFRRFGNRQKDYFVTTINDAHPNGKGYRVIAQNIYDKMSELGLFGLSSRNKTTYRNSERN